MNLIPLAHATFSFLLLAFTIASGVGKLSAQVESTPAQLPSAQQWVDAKLASMSVEERIGQLFIARAHSDGSAGTLKELTALVKSQHLGGLCFFSGSPQAQVEWTNALQRASAKIPLLVSMDAEWGAAMRFKDQAPRFPYAITLGAANDVDLTRRIGRETGRELRLLGVHMSFATRSFSNACTGSDSRDNDRSPSCSCP